MISHNLKVHTMQIYSKLLIAVNDRKAFSFSNCVVAFVAVKSTGAIPNWVIKTIVVKLREDSTYCGQAGVRMDDEGFLKIRVG